MVLHLETISSFSKYSRGVRSQKELLSPKIEEGILGLVWGWGLWGFEGEILEVVETFWSLVWGFWEF